MQLRNLLHDDDAVSPVIGVILMVAITVILAAVIASFVLGLGDTDDVAPSPTFEYDYTSENDGEDGWLEISVTGGDSFTAGQVEITGDVNGDWHEFDPDGDMDSDSTISAGDSIAIPDEDPDPNDGLEDDFEIDIVWESEDGDSTSTIGGTEGPDA